jgi:hypothetical protein
MADLQGESWHKEQRRRSQDLIRVANPTEKDFILIWEDQKFVIPNKESDKGWGKGMRVMQRYLAQKYTKEIVDRIIMEKADKELENRKTKLQERGDVDPTYNANIQLQYAARTDDPKTREPIEDMIWLGIEEEFGVDQEFVEIKPDAPEPMKDPFQRLNAKKYAPDKLKIVEPIKEIPPVVVEKIEAQMEKPPLYVSKKDQMKG